MPITYRSCQRADLEPLEWEGLFTPHRRIIEATFDASCRGEQLMILGVAEERPIAQIWIDLIRERASGAAVLWALRVHPAFQGQGFGSALITHAERLIAGRGYGRAEIDVQVDNLRARALYERAGYQGIRIATREWVFQDPDGREVRQAQRLVIMVKPLVPEVTGHHAAP